MTDWDNAFTGKPKSGMASGSHSFGGAGSFFRAPYSRDLNGVDVVVSGVPDLDIQLRHRVNASIVGVVAGG